MSWAGTWTLRPQIDGRAFIRREPIINWEFDLLACGRIRHVANTIAKMQRMEKESSAPREEKADVELALPAGPRSFARFSRIRNEVDLAVRQLVLEFLHAGIGDVTCRQVQHLKFGQTFEMLQSSVGDVR